MPQRGKKKALLGKERRKKKVSGKTKEGGHRMCSALCGDGLLGMKCWERPCGSGIKRRLIMLVDAR